MTLSNKPEAHPSVQDVALIVGGGPGISSSCARLFARNGMRVAIAARNPDKPSLQTLEETYGANAWLFSGRVESLVTDEPFATGWKPANAYFYGLGISL